MHAARLAPSVGPQKRAPLSSEVTREGVVSPFA